MRHQFRDALGQGREQLEQVFKGGGLVVEAAEEMVGVRDIGRGESVGGLKLGKAPWPGGEEISQRAGVRFGWPG